MNAADRELVFGPLRGLTRAMVGWGLGLGALVAATVAFWPAFKGASGITEAIDQLPSGIVEAFGLADFGTPAGFLRGNLYEFLVPLLLSIAAVAIVNGLTAGEEDAGRLETYLSQPVSRRHLFIGRVLAALLWLVLLSLVIVVVQLVSDTIFGLEIDAGRIVATVVLCGLLAALFGASAVAMGGWFARPSLVLAVGIALVVASYLVSALFPLVDALEPISRLSPWSWALGGDPLVQPSEPWRYIALAIPSVILAAIGVFGFQRRDVRAA